MRHRLVATTTAALVLALAGFTGTSLAGNGNGNGNGNGGANSQSSQSSQSGPHSQSTAPSTSHGNGSSSKQSDTSPSNPATAGNNSQGVKPSNSTKHDTYATASSGATKKYGNGKTAGQIAQSAGKSGDTVLHGPGNSQPHKTTTCGHSHEVDVHALKSKAGKCGATAPAAVKHEQKTLHVHTSSPAKHETPPAAPAKPSTPSTRSTPAMAHVTICHATGSATNPYVRISPSVSGVYHGHLGHQDLRDIVPPFTYNGQTFSENWDSAGQAIYNNGCTVAAAAAAAQATVTHSTQSSPTITAAKPAVVTPAVVTPATVTPAATAVAAGGVKGATATLKPAKKAAPAHKVAAAATKAKPRGGVLGTTTRLGHTVASSRLPFTGLPLWIFAALAAGLILIGAAVRRSASSRI